MATPTAFSPEVLALAPFVQTGSADTIGLIAMGVIDLTIYVPTAFTPQMIAYAVIEEHPADNYVPEINQYSVMAVYGEGAPEDFRLRAWGFTLDGHRFYVLHLGEEGTFVYDFTTQQWSEWKTEGFTTGWNAYVGLNWGADDRIIAGDRQNPTVWEIDPERFTDEGYKDIKRTVTAIIPQSGWSWKSLSSVQLIASVGDPSAIFGTPPTIEITYSDDQGVTYDAPADSVIELVPGEYGQQLDWMSLGSFTAPGRVINITDWGGVARIDRATYEVE